MKEKTMERICDESFDCAALLLDAVKRFHQENQQEDAASPGIPLQQEGKTSTPEFLRTLPQIYVGLGVSAPPAIQKYAEKCTGAKAEFFAMWFSMIVADGIEDLLTGVDRNGC